MLTHPAVSSVAATAVTAQSQGQITPGGVLVVLAIIGVIVWMFGISRGEYRGPVQLLREHLDRPADHPAGPGGFRRRWVLPFRRGQARDAGFGNFTPQVSEQGPPAGGQQGGWQGTPAGGPAGAPGPVPEWGTPRVPPQITTGQPPVPGPLMPDPAPVPVVSQPASGVYLSGQGSVVDLQPAPATPPQEAYPQVKALVSDPRMQERRTAVARALPRIRAAQHGDRGRIMADLATDWGVDPRTIHNDIQALTTTDRRPGQVVAP